MAGAEISVQSGHVKSYQQIKALERKLGGSCTPETQARSSWTWSGAPVSMSDDHSITLYTIYRPIVGIMYNDV